MKQHAILAVLALWAPAACWAADRPQLPKPLSVQVAALDKTILVGEMVGFDADGFDFRNREGQTTQIAWSQLAAKDVFLLHVRLLDREGDAERWLGLGRMLREMEGGVEYSERALTQAVRVAPALAEQAEAIRAADAPQPAADAAATDRSDAPQNAEVAAVTPARPGSAPPAAAPTDPLAGKVWGHLSPQEREVAIARLKAKAADAQEIAPNLRLYETEYFLFYTDLGAAEARKWVSLLDRMYNRLLTMFDIPKGTNIWHGKALVFVFAREEDFRAMEAQKYGTDLPWAVGVCHSLGNGEVHITFFRPADEVRFANVLVHESVHGFLHRYRSPRHVVSWVNEGLAEWIAFELVDSVIGNGNRRTVQQEAASDLRQRGTLGGMFDAGHISPDQYRQTFAMTDILIAEGRSRYVNFINAIKDGQEWEEAFEKHFEMKVAEFLVRYSQYLNLPNTITR